MRLVTADLETFYDKNFSLSKITTEEYVRSEQFEVIGLGIKFDDGDPQWVPGPEVKEFLKAQDFSDSAILCHNTMFDGAILSWLYGVKPKLWLDTLCMARALHGVDAGGSLKALAERYQIGVKGDEVIHAIGKRFCDFNPAELSRYGDYCCNDVELTYNLFSRMASVFPAKEIKLIDLTIRMFTEPVLGLNLSLLEQHLRDVRDRKAELLRSAGHEQGALMSNDMFAKLLQDMGVDPPKKISARTGKEAWAFAKTDEEFKALLDHDDVRVQALVAARLGVKTTLDETRTQRFIEIAKRGALPVPLKYYGAHTGRWSACVVGDTRILVYDPQKRVTEKQIVDVLPDDLVWDGEEFVPHAGVVFNGFAEVITWDGITGTPDHVVFTDVGPISLHSAMQGQHRIQIADSPTKNAVDTARKFAGNQ